MVEMHEEAFDIKVRLTMLDCFRYYFSLFNLKPLGLIISILSGIIIALYFFSLVSLIYIAFATGVLDWAAGKGMLLDAVIITLFSTPFLRTYLIAYSDAKSHKLLDKDIDVRITGDKLIVLPEDSKVEYSWKKMYKLFDFSHGFALLINKEDRVFVMPKRCFRNKEQIKAVKEIIAKYKKRK